MRIYTFFGLETQTILYHEMNIHLKRKGWESFAGILAVKNGIHLDFLEKQADVKYDYLDSIDDIEETILEEDFDVKQVEKWQTKLDSSLWDLVIADRELGKSYLFDNCMQYDTEIEEYIDHEFLCKMTYVFLDFYEKRLREYKPDLVFVSGIASLSALAFVKVCAYLGIPYFYIRSARVSNLVTITCNSYNDRFMTAEILMKEILKSSKYIEVSPRIEEYIDSFKQVEGSIPLFAETTLKNKNMLKDQSWVYWWLRKIYELYIYSKSDRSGRKFLRKKKGLSVWRIQFKKEFYLKRKPGKVFNSKPDLEQAYIYFPLHMNPEASTMVYAPNFSNQLTLVEALSKSIPMSHKLYIKEHPRMLGIRPPSFYQKILQFHNVDLISPDFKSHLLISKADLIATITGTTGWEAIMKMKPVITFGDCFYTHLGLSEKCTDLGKLETVILKKVFKEKINEQEHRRVIRAFLSSIEKSSFELDWSLLWKRLDVDNRKEKDLKFAESVGDGLISAHEFYIKNKDKFIYK